MNPIDALELRPLGHRALPRAYGLFCYAAGGLITPYLLLFAGGVLVPKTVDGGAPGSAALAAAIDLGLLALFGLQHSLMARPRIKRWVVKTVSEDLERSTYVLAASLSLSLVFVFWRPIPAVCWRWEGARAAGGALFALGVLTVYASAFSLDHFRLLGLSQAWFGAGATQTDTNLRIAGLYRLVRHPLMTGLLLVFWSTHEMTAGHLLFAAAMTGYIALGTWFEERDLMKQFGEQYAAYRARTPAFVPLPVFRTSGNGGAAR
jgi:protein-S-isoprenylcysteine O-methyltransferase Ste14